MFKRILFVVLLMALALSMLIACEECDHEWSEGTCAVLSRCTKCGESRGGLSEVHEYENGICIYCGKVSDETKAEISEFINTMYIEMWLQKYNEKEPMVEPAQAEVAIDEIGFSNGKLNVSCKAFLKMKSQGYFMTELNLVFERAEDGSFVIMEEAAQEIGMPIELDPYKKYALYLLEGNPKFVRKTGNGEERYVLEFKGDEMIRSYYDEEGNYSIIQKMDYIIHRTPEYRIVIASDDTYKRTMILKSGKYIHDNEDVYTFEFEQ